jgi:hypothetical protein
VVDGAASRGTRVSAPVVLGVRCRCLGVVGRRASQTWEWLSVGLEGAACLLDEGPQCGSAEADGLLWRGT